MDPARSQQIRDLYQAALERPPGERASFVAQRAGNDAGLRESVELLLSQGDFTAARHVEPSAMAPGFPPGTEIGNYRIETLLGEGGMGSVYRATDGKLHRPVAIKFLSAGLADANARRRFQQEAETASSLNHPHIVTVHDIGEHDGRQYIVSELIDGGTLADGFGRTRGWKQRVELLIGVADALAAAHAADIVHRDVKPGNILIGRNGYAKLADFGLAKLIAGDGAKSASQNTGRGVVIGTVAYMSPEQAAGQPLDERSDIFSFGVVLYEALAGRRPFEAANDLELMKTIIHGAPPPLPDDVPAALKMAVDKTLEKDAAERYQSMRELVVDLKRVVQRRVATIETAPAPGTRSRPWTLAALGVVAAAAALAAAVLATLYFAQAPPAAPQVVRFRIATPGLSITSASPIGIAADGSRLAYLAGAGAASRVWVRSLDAFDARPLAGTDGATGLFFGPDAESIAFVVETTLKRVRVEGGPAQTLASGVFDTGGSWSAAGVVLITAFDSAGAGFAGIGRIAAEGGTVMPVSKPDAARGDPVHFFPLFLPDGRRFLYLATDSSNSASLFLGSLDGAAKRLAALETVGNGAPYFGYAAGHVLFLRDSTLFAQSLDLDSEALVGEPVPLASPVGLFAAAEQALAYYAPTTGDPELGVRSGVVTELRWFGRDGTPQGVLGPPGVYQAPRLSPNGRQLAVERMVAGNQDIWTIDVARPVPVRLTFHPADDTSPIWSPDGNEIMFSSGRQLGGTVAALYRRSASGAGTDELVYSPGAGRLIGATDWRESGIVFTTAAVAEYTTNAGDVWRLPGSGEGTAERLIASPMRESAGRVSPDGRWILYRSYESGAYQIVVQPYPDISKGKWQVGTRDAIEAKWRADGREIFFLASDGNMMAVDVAAGDTFAVGEPHVLFQTGLAIPSTPFIASRFDVTADGQRFLINLPQSTAAGADASGAPDRVINVVLNWAEALPRRGR